MNINKIKVALLSCLLIFLLGEAIAANKNNKLMSRDAHQNIENGLILESTIPATQNIELNTQVQFDVQLLANSLPVSSANIDWQIIQNVTSATRQTAYFVIGDSLSSTLETVTTDANGYSRISFNTGEVAAIYRVTASASVTVNSTETITLIRTFLINAGIQASIKTGTPENAVALTLDTLCPQLEENTSTLTAQQQALLDRCNAIQQAISEGKSIEVSKVLREISPEEIAVQSQVGVSFGNQQISNIASRLNAVRRGSTRLSFNNLGLRYRGKAIPIDYMLNSLFATDESTAATETGALLNNRLGVFANGNASLGSRSATSKEDAFEFGNYGLTLGADYRINSTRFAGAALGVSKSDVKISDKGGEMSANGLSLNLYINQYIRDQWYIDGVVNIGNNQFDMKRGINFDLNGNAVNRIARSNTNGLQQGISVSTGYEVYDGPLAATFYGNLNYSKLNINGFTESGAQELDLRIGKQSTNTTTSSIGAQIQYTHSSRQGVFVPFIGLSWVHEFSNAPDTITGAFANDQFNSTFNINTDKPDSNYFSNVQGITAILPRGISAFIKMENIMGRDFYKITNVSMGGRMELQF